MAKNDKTQELSWTERAMAAGVKVYQVAKTVFIIAVVVTSIVGTYVLVNTELRNQTIDFAQNQTQAQAQGPKE